MTLPGALGTAATLPATPSPHGTPHAQHPCMTLSMINLFIAHALGIAFLAAVILMGVGLVVFGSASVFRLRHG